jgi:hypothetical protein
MLLPALWVACGESPSPPGDSDSDVDVDADSDSDSDGDGDLAVVLNQLYFALDSAGDFVELQNPTPSDQPLTGWSLATSRTRVYRFAAGLTVPTGGCVTLYWGPNDPCDFANEACGVGGFVNDLTPTGGDVALYASDAVESADAVVDYVRWGSEPDFDSLEDVAALAREWPTGDSVVTSSWTDGAALQYDDSGEAGETHWSVNPSPRRCE